MDVVSISIHSACGGTLDVLATVFGLWMFWLAKSGGYSGLQGSSSDLVRHEPNSIEMRCDGGFIWFPSRYIPPAAEHSMSLQLEMRCDSGLMWFPSRYIPPSAEHSMSLQLFKVVAVLVCKRSSSDLVRHETNSIEMRRDKTQNILAVRDAP